MSTLSTNAAAASLRSRYYPVGVLTLAVLLLAAQGCTAPSANDGNGSSYGGNGGRFIHGQNLNGAQPMSNIISMQQAQQQYPSYTASSAYDVANSSSNSSNSHHQELVYNATQQQQLQQQKQEQYEQLQQLLKQQQQQQYEQVCNKLQDYQPQQQRRYSQNGPQNSTFNTNSQVGVQHPMEPMETIYADFDMDDFDSELAPNDDISQLLADKAATEIQTHNTRIPLRNSPGVHSSPLRNSPGVHSSANTAPGAHGVTYYSTSSQHSPATGQWQSNSNAAALARLTNSSPSSNSPSPNHYTQQQHAQWKVQQPRSMQHNSPHNNNSHHVKFLYRKQPSTTNFTSDVVNRSSNDTAVAQPHRRWGYRPTPYEVQYRQKLQKVKQEKVKQEREKRACEEYCRQRQQDEAFRKFQLAQQEAALQPHQQDDKYLRQQQEEAFKNHQPQQQHWGTGVQASADPKFFEEVQQSVKRNHHDQGTQPLHSG